MKEIPKNLSPRWFSLRLNRIIRNYDIPHSELMKAAGIKDESFLEPYLNGNSMQITDTQKKLYQACADIIAVNLNTEILDAGINYEYIANILNVSRTTIDNWLNRYNEASKPFKQFDRIKAVIESSQYYLGLKRLPDKEFAKFFDNNGEYSLGKQWKKNGLSIEKIYNDLGLTKNEVSLIRNEQLRLSARKQYEILSKAYNMYIDYTYQYYEGFEDIAKKLYHLLNLQYHEDIISNFANIYSELKKMIKFDMYELYSLLKKYYSKEEFTISQKAFELLCTQKNFYWDIKEKSRILEYIMFVAWRNEDEFKPYGTAYLTMVYCNLKNIRKGIEESRLEKKLKDLSSDFKQYPLETQRIILSHAEVFLDIGLDRFFMKNKSASYALRAFSCYNGVRSSYKRNTDIFYYIDHFIDLFRNLPQYTQLTIIRKYSKDVPFYLDPYTKEFRYLTQCCDMMFQTMDAPLSDIVDSSPPKLGDYLLIKKPDRKFWKYYEENKIRKRLQYTPRDWNLMAIIMLLITKGKDLSLLEEELRLSQKTEQPSTKDNDKSNRKIKSERDYFD